MQSSGWNYGLATWTPVTPRMIGWLDPKAILTEEKEEFVE